LRPQNGNAILTMRQDAQAMCVSLLCAVLVGTVSLQAQAETQVEGQPGALSIRATNAPIGEILDALGPGFKVKYRAAPETGRNLSGVYSGTLDQVLWRILDGYDYVIEAFDDGTQVVFVGLSSPPPTSSRPALPLGSPAVPTSPVR
jgi:hypothetical protein